MLHGTQEYLGTAADPGGETPPPRAHAFCGQGEDRRADDMSSNNMVKLVSNDGDSS